MKKEMKIIFISIICILLIIFILILISAQQGCNNCRKECKLMLVQGPNTRSANLNPLLPSTEKTISLPCNTCYGTLNEIPKIVRLPPITQDPKLEPYQPENCPLFSDIGLSSKIRTDIDIEFQNQFQLSPEIRKRVAGNLQNYAAGLLYSFSRENLPVTINIVKASPGKKDYSSSTFIQENGKKRLALTIATSNSNDIESLFKTTMERTLLKENGLDPDMTYCQNADDVLKSLRIGIGNGKPVTSDDFNNFLKNLKDPKKREEYIIDGLFDLAIGNDIDQFRAFQENSILKTLIDERYKGRGMKYTDKERIYINLLKNLAKVRDKEELKDVLEQEGRKILTQEAKNLIYEALRTGLGLENTDTDAKVLRHIINSVSIPYLQKGDCSFYFYMDYRY